MKCYILKPRVNDNILFGIVPPHTSYNFINLFSKQVYRVEYLLLDDFKSDDTRPYTRWSMERSCSSECKNFCVTMGGKYTIHNFFYRFSAVC